eukprot:gnl/TRDRNA2_/TRDRNA2_180136_c0_seq1.p1 gnl/TRDRNA2_/TRDRNA2_180136_c0~~gnl/TRDRNA2_/TRDRNA2_180136_c0_seq1.p1  ORF type:complete len:795 (-),score=113.94 gnl/TRDRNA2_/TRDRNA2_180136_c0_seq1:48-2330(-)
MAAVKARQRAHAAFLALALVYFACCLQGCGRNAGSWNDTAVDEDPHFIQLVPWDEAYRKAKDVVKNMSSAEKISLLDGIAYAQNLDGYYVGSTPSIPRLDVPALKMLDSGSGFRATSSDQPAKSVTIWPSQLALASTWDSALIENVAKAIGQEFRGKGANVMLGPSLTVGGSVHGSRNFESFSGGDPYLSAQYARAFVRGVQSEGVMASVNHEPVVHDERTAWEFYYPPLEAAVEEGLGFVLCSPNGTLCAHDEMLHHDLREKMGFQGFVHPDMYMYTKVEEEMKHGMGQNMSELNGAFRPETLNPELQTSAAEHVLASIYHMRLDENPGCTPPNCATELEATVTSEEHQSLALDAATSAVTLLQNNDDLLPLKLRDWQKLAVIGSAASAKPVNGTSGRFVSPLEAISGHLQGLDIELLTSTSDDSKRAAAIADSADVALVFVHAGASHWTGSVLPHELITAVAKTGTPTAVLMHTSGAVTTPWRDEVDAIANLFLGGEQTGTAWATVLFGDASPSGKLPVMFPASEADMIEPVDSHSSSGKSGVLRDPKFRLEAELSERLFPSYGSSVLKAAFPFGHGLSYTKFEYGKPTLEQHCKDQASSPDVACIWLAVTNVGKAAGAEVVQVYLEFPLAADTPKLLLRSFKKTQVLEPRASQSLMISLSKHDLSLWEVGSGWKVQKNVVAHIGSSSADIRQKLTISHEVAPSSTTHKHIMELDEHPRNHHATAEVPQRALVQQAATRTRARATDRERPVGFLATHY